MIDKFVTHIKNIIFFKIVIYVLLIISLFTLIPIFQDSLNNASLKREKSKAFLQNATMKLESIKSFEDQISDINRKYQQLIRNSFQSGCFSRTVLIHEIESLAQKYHLFEPINCKIFRTFNNENLLSTNGNIKLHYYELDIKFKAPDYYTILGICTDLRELLPKGTVVTSTNIHSIDAITPKIVKKLNLLHKPGLLDVKMKIQIREMAYEK
ncbi:hypothetical protein OAP56_02740 [Rickettsiaceae bacterium]|nr:hypothetical protein [Rickettsiaceae bacterium]